MSDSAVQIGTLIKAYLILLVQPLVNVLRVFDLDSDSSNGLPDNLQWDAATHYNAKLSWGSDHSASHVKNDYTSCDC